MSEAIWRVGIGLKRNPLQLQGIFYFLVDMKKLLFISFIIFSCTSPTLDGTWELRLHESYDNQKTVGLEKAEKPFEKWEILEGKLLIDDTEEFYSLRKDTITITFNENFRHFIIVNHSETSLLLKSSDLTPGTYSFYYFFK